jgi:hypothetical protein
VTRLDDNHPVARIDESLRFDAELLPDFGNVPGFIGVLCIDPEGDLVIVELKRDRTPRETTAQALDYASWVKGLSAERVTEIAEDHLAADLAEKFTATFKIELPETLNGNHRILVRKAFERPEVLWWKRTRSSIAYEHEFDEGRRPLST